MSWRSKLTAAGRSWSRRPKLFLITAAVIALIALADLPTTTSVMVDFVPRTVSQPLYAKAITFIDRDIQMRQLSAAVVGDARDPRDKAERILRWTTANIRPTPQGMPVVDDHPYHIVVRGYGEVDQAADVFANLAAYAGMPGGLVFSRAADGTALYAFAVLEIDGADRLFDVREQRAFRDGSGALAPLERLRADPTLLEGLPSPPGSHGRSYRELVAALETSQHRRTSDQMPFSRLVNEIGRLFARR